MPAAVQGDLVCSRHLEHRNPQIRQPFPSAFPTEGRVEHDSLARAAQAMDDRRYLRQPESPNSYGGSMTPEKFTVHISDEILQDMRARIAATRWAPEMERSEEHTSELQSLMRTSYAVFCLKQKTL